MIPLADSVTICSVIRLHTIMEFGNSTNPTYDYSALAIWSLVEIDVGVICACMPGIAALFHRVFPRLATTRGSSGSSSSERSGRKHNGGSGNSGGDGDYYRRKGFARMDDGRGGELSMITSATLSYADHKPGQYDSKSEELELDFVDRDCQVTPSSDLESAAYVAQQPRRYLSSCRNL
jgi:hypothetical protein